MYRFSYQILPTIKEESPSYEIIFINEVRGKASFVVTDNKNRSYGLTVDGKSLLRLVKERGSVLEEASTIILKCLNRVHGRIKSFEHII